MFDPPKLTALSKKKMEQKVEKERNEKNSAFFQHFEGSSLAQVLGAQINRKNGKKSNNLVNSMKLMGCVVIKEKG